MRLVLDGMSIHAASKRVQIRRNTLAKYLKAYPGISSYEVKDVTFLSEGRRSYLSEMSMETLKLFSLALDFNGYTISWPTIVKSIIKLKKRELNKNEVEPPSAPTVRKIVKTLGIPVRTLQKGVSIDACRESKANSKYLGDYFAKLQSLLLVYQISPQNIFNADEVGVQLSDMNLKFITTWNCVRGNMSNEHVTVMITTSAVGSLLPPYLLFPGNDSSAVPNVMNEHRSEMWGNFSDLG